MGEGGETVTEFERVYREYFRDVELYLLALCQEEDLARELTADTFFAAMEGYSKFKGDCHIKTWLCSIAKNRYISHLRRLGKTVPLEEAERRPSPVNIEERIVDRETAMELHKILHSLPEPYKEVFSLRVFGQLSFGQIGEVFGKTANWACVTYHRAKSKIQEGLG